MNKLRTQKHLWLFDIDGTLVNINHIHLAAYKNNYRERINREISDKVIISLFGMSEHEMHRHLFRKLGIPSTSRLVDRILKSVPTYFRKALANTKTIKPLPGVVEFLTYLKTDKQHIGIVTGNIKTNAELILNKSGLRKYFAIVSSDDGKSQRWQIVQRAIDTARQKNYDFDKVIVIGDTKYDIKAGKKVNTYTVAVATGSDSLATLQAKHPTITLQKIDCKKILAIVE